MDYIFIGSGAFAAQVLGFLNPSPVVVITKPDRRGGRGMKTILPSPVKAIAKEKNCQVMEVHHAQDLKTLLKEYASVPVVLTDFGMIIPEELLSIPTYGIWNIHPSLLPHYRGSTPLQSVILNGDTKSGVTIIQIDTQVDHGPILAQQTVTLTPEETTQTLSHKLAETGARLMNTLLTDPQKTIKQAQPQNHTQASYTKRLTKEDGYIAIEKLRPYLLPILTQFNVLHMLPPDTGIAPLDEMMLHRMIRALNPWPGVWTKQQETIIKFMTPTRLQVGSKTYTLRVHGQ
ncbi:MAG: methionyl-tRNA formyltransferase [Candidatus Roizmanbacteria bacterium]|nr:methionyl-tRNA formyltransferase [Candidatus Roizmanbacteria bacterium]